MSAVQTMQRNGEEKKMPDDTVNVRYMVHDVDAAVDSSKIRPAMWSSSFNPPVKQYAPNVAHGLRRSPA